MTDDETEDELPITLPAELEERVREVIEAAQPMYLHVDHGFILDCARASGWDAKQLGKYYPHLSLALRQDLLGRRLTLDQHGLLYELH
jgi:hypothetical protein